MNVFAVLWAAVKNNQLTQEDIKDTFFNSISDAVTYKESWKCGKYWSVNAWQHACAIGNTHGLVSEHVLPRGLALRHALSLPTVEKAMDFIWQNSFECVITKSEDLLLNKELKSVGFPENPWKRYALAGIQVMDVQYPAGSEFLDDLDRAKLLEHGLLTAWPH